MYTDVELLGDDAPDGPDSSESNDADAMTALDLAFAGLGAAG
jgi:hypothetical protein